MKKLVILLCLLVIALGVVGGCGWTAIRVARQVFNYQLSVSNWEFKTFGWCTKKWGLAEKLKGFLGGKYIVLFLNNTELRPAGGFAGSYATISAQCSGSSAHCGIQHIKIQDIYEPDGKLVGHVDPPYPIQEAFGQGWWKLRDANWDVDFASSAGTIKWFLEQGGETNIPGIFVINQLTVGQLISIYGPIQLATYPDMVTDKNFYQLAQSYAEARLEDGKTDKRGFLGAVGVALWERMKTLNPLKTLKALKLLYSELEKGEILIWSRDEQMQKEIEKREWAGRLTAGWTPDSDYLYIVESNLGANKANCCIKRNVTVRVSGNTKDIEVKWVNNNEFEEPKPPVFWGGNYRDYVRVIIPEGSKILGIKILGRELRQATDEDFDKPVSLREGLSEDVYVIEKRGDLQIIGFWAVVGAKKEVTVELEFLNNAPSKEMLLKHQPGSGVTDYQILVDGVIKANGQLDKDIQIAL